MPPLRAGPQEWPLLVWFLVQGQEGLRAVVVRVRGVPGEVVAVAIGRVPLGEHFLIGELALVRLVVFFLVAAVIVGFLQQKCLWRLKQKSMRAYLILLDVALDDGLAGFGEVLGEVLPELPSIAGGHAEGGVFPRGDSLVVGTGNQVHSILQAFIRVINKTAYDFGVGERAAGQPLDVVLELVVVVVRLPPWLRLGLGLLRLQLLRSLFSLLLFLLCLRACVL